MPVRPAQIARMVMRLGMTSRSGISRSRGPRPESSGGPLGSKGGKGVSMRRAPIVRLARRLTTGPLAEPNSASTAFRRQSPSARASRAAAHRLAGTRRGASRSGSGRSARRHPAARSPFDQQRMRRATRPAIWTTPIWPAGLDRERVALIVVAGLVELGIDEAAGAYS
jgi:hypothetical protein